MSKRPLMRPAQDRLSQDQPDCCVAVRRELRIAPGDRLLLQANRREQRLINGQIVEVKSVEDTTGAITLADGRVLPSDLRGCVHSVQCKTFTALIWLPFGSLRALYVR